MGPAEGAPNHFALLTPPSGPPPRDGRQRFVALGAWALVALTVVILLETKFKEGSPARPVAMGVLIASTLGLYSFLRSRARSEPAPVLERELLVDEAGLTLLKTGAKPERLIRFNSGFGLSLLTSASRAQWVVAITSPERVVCVGAELLDSEKHGFEPLVPQAVTASGDDLEMARVLPSGEPMVMQGSALHQFLDALLEVDPGALERCYLSDASGGQVVLDQQTFRARQCLFRLDQPFEWGTALFHEEPLDEDAQFQATWIRQSHDEVVLVSLYSQDVRRSIEDIKREPSWHPDAFLLRDVRLSEAYPGPPPPRDKRVAVDRLFMLPLRRALDRAHRLDHPSVPNDLSVR